MSDPSSQQWSPVGANPIPPFQPPPPQPARPSGLFGLLSMILGVAAILSSGAAMVGMRAALSAGGMVTFSTVLGIVSVGALVLSVAGLVLGIIGVTRPGAPRLAGFGLGVATAHLASQALSIFGGLILSW